ncbi:hypothetical protein MKZ38_006048 [Zalerion maritima]|uniref:Uncharacterized protein n=1 Tax=Zalerion maritima TaxID=339359 RepID=A0AAD5RJA3_9PEZI|nr:hypothetical protein MKZ38_006048 [Zalerion maritima]
MQEPLDRAQTWRKKSLMFIDTADNFPTSPAASQEVQFKAFEIHHIQTLSTSSQCGPKSHHLGPKILSPNQAVALIKFSSTAIMEAEGDVLTNSPLAVADEDREEQKPDSLSKMDPARHIVVKEPNGNKPETPVEQAPDPDEDIPAPHFSWLDSHPSIVVILAGAQEEGQQAFVIQKDFLCSKSSYFREYFHRSPDEPENVINFPDVTPETFGFVQNFLYTDHVYPTIEHLPGYEVLINIWKVGHDLGVDGLCDKALEAMQECRQITEHIPATPLLVQVWNETPEGSSIRTLLLGWAAEYMRSSDARAEFAKSLPKEVLSELVVAISSLGPPTPAIGSSEPSIPQRSSVVASPVVQNSLPPPPPLPPTASRKNVHYIPSNADEDDDGEYPARGNKKFKRVSLGGSSAGGQKSTAKKAPRQSLPKKVKRRPSATTSFAPGHEFSMEKKLEFCADLLTRMLSGPGFWTRLVGPFKHPVVPEEDGVPDYFDKVKNPMDLGTVKSKMDKREYNNDAEFAGDIRQIFENCFMYWTDKDPMWTTCVKFQKTFEEKYAEMNKWLSKMSGHEGDDQ